MTKLISLIIPIYNVEEYIEDCLKSFILQLTDEIEVILVNDGTPDDSMTIAKDIIDSLPEKIKNCFKVLEQVNQGQSVARNNALKVATGEYIAFLDSDDILEFNYFAVIKEKINLFQPDFIQFKSFRFSEQLGKNDFHVGAKLKGLHENSFSVKKHVFNQSAWFPWLNVYKRTLFENGDRFPVGIYYEDAALVPILYSNAKTVLFLSDILYGYRYNPTGSLMNMSEKNIQKHIKSFNYVIDLYCKKIKKSNIYSPSLVSLTQAYISFLLKHRGIKIAFKEYRRIDIKNMNVNTAYLEKRGNILFYRFGPLFTIFTKVIGRD